MTEKLSDAQERRWNEMAERSLVHIEQAVFMFATTLMMLDSRDALRRAMTRIALAAVNVLEAEFGKAGVDEAMMTLREAVTTKPPTAVS